MSLTALIDYDSGNLHSAQKAFEKMSQELGGGKVVVTSDPEVVRNADRIVLPGDGAFPACKSALLAVPGMVEALIEGVQAKARPFMGICVGMQMLATRGLEYEPTDGLGWIEGEITKIAPGDASLKVPHMGWNDLVIEQAHPVLDGIKTGNHAYFVHSWAMQVADPEHRIAHVGYGGDVTAIVGHDNIIGLQFHPEKSQGTGLHIISNFLKWAP